MQWFDRKFQFPFETDVYPGILERMRGLIPRVRDLVATLPDSSWTQRVDDKWSAQEHLGHLYDLEELFAGRIDDFLGGLPTLREADLQNRKTHEAGHNDRPLSVVAGRLVGARARHVGMLEELAPADFARIAKHPRLDQPMRLIDSVYFTAEHDDHHLAAVRALVGGEDR